MRRIADRKARFPRASLDMQTDEVSSKLSRNWLALRAGGMRIGRTLAEHRAEREVVYYDAKDRIGSGRSATCSTSFAE